MPGAVVGIRSTGAKGSYGGDDDVLVDRQQRFAVQTHRDSRRRAVVMNDHIHISDQPMQQATSRGVIQIERYALLARVQIQIQPAAFGMRIILRKRPPPPGNVAGNRLHLDHPRPQRSQKLAAIRPGNQRRNLQHPKVGQGSG